MKLCLATLLTPNGSHTITTHDFTIGQDVQNQLFSSQDHSHGGYDLAFEPKGSPANEICAPE